MVNKSSDILKNCIENGVPLGHYSRKWNPKMLKYLLMEKSGSHIIDINCIIDELNKSCDKLMSIVAAGGKVLFVCTKKIGSNYIKKVADELNMTNVTKKWFAGTITNFVYVVKKMIKKSETLNAILESNQYKFLSKKEQLILKRGIAEKEKTLEGINKKLYKTPNAIVIVDLLKEHNAFKEAVSNNITIFGLMDTNFYSDKVTYPIPCNDDSLSSITFVIEHLKNAILKGLARIKDNETNEKAN